MRNLVAVPARKYAMWSSVARGACHKKPNSELSLTQRLRREDICIHPHKSLLNALEQDFAYASWWPQLTVFLKTNI